MGNDLTPRETELQGLEVKIAEFERLLNDVATPTQLKEWLFRICEAEDIRITKDGDVLKVPNWDARVKGFDRVMDILRYNHKDRPMDVGKPQKIVIQIIDTKVQEPKSVDVDEK